MSCNYAYLDIDVENLFVLTERFLVDRLGNIK